jgi:hypothetical protein
MKVTKRQLKRIIKEEKRKVLLERGDPIADEMLGDFILKFQAALLDYEVDITERHRLGSQEQYESTAYQVAEEVEDFVRKRLADLYAGDVWSAGVGR